MRSLKEWPDGCLIDHSLKEQLVADYKTADITDLDKLILSYAEKITREAYAVNQTYIDNLRKRGLTDHMLHDIAPVASYFNYVSRLADALGVELEG